ARQRAIQIACRCLNRTPGIAAEPPNGVRDGAWIFGVRMVRPRRTTGNLGVHREKGQRRPTSSTGSAGGRQKIQGFSLPTRAMSPQQLADFIGSERKLWKPVIEQMGLATQ